MWRKSGRFQSLAHATAGEMPAKRSCPGISRDIALLLLFATDDLAAESVAGTCNSEAVSHHGLERDFCSSVILSLPIPIMCGAISAIQGHVLGLRR